MHYRTFQLAVIALVMSFASAVNGADEEITVADIIARCHIKTNAADQRSRLDISISDIRGEILKDRQTIYYWKDYAGENNLWGKTFLSVLGPPPEKDIAYLRFDYVNDGDREQEQWIYIPRLHHVRRLAERDDGDQLWGVVGDDLRVLRMNDGVQRLLSTENDMRGTIYWVEIIPESKKLPYVKVNAAFLRKADDWNGCTRWRTEFIDKDNNIIKQITEDWNQQQQVWYRQKIQIWNLDSTTTTEYLFHDVEFNIGLTDDDFTVRRLPGGNRSISGKQ